MKHNAQTGLIPAKRFSPDSPGPRYGNGHTGETEPNTCRLTGCAMTLILKKEKIMNVLILMGSPRLHGNTAELCKGFRAAAGEIMVLCPILHIFPDRRS